MSYKKVKNIFWEGDTLVIETESGEVTKYKGAYIKNIKWEYEENDSLVEELPTIKHGDDEGFLDWVRKGIV